TRKWTLTRGAEALLSDTVGFIKDLPHQLVASFKATLEEAINADLLLHVVDASNPDAFGQIESVNAVLEEIGCGQNPVVILLNKLDAVKKIGELEVIQTLFPEALCISARTGLGLEQLKQTVLAKYKGGELLLRVNTPQSNGKVLSFLRACGTVLNEEYCDGSVLIDARLGQNQLPHLKRLRPQAIEILQS
ncbi:MAG: GTPase, partial [Planctomycetota bacterium]